MLKSEYKVPKEEVDTMNNYRRRGYRSYLSQNYIRPSIERKICVVLLRIIELLEKVFASDAFAATVVGVCLILVVGTIGGIEMAKLDVRSGVGFIIAFIGVASVIIYKKNNE